MPITTGRIVAWLVIVAGMIVAAIAYRSYRQSFRLRDAYGVVVPAAVAVVVLLFSVNFAVFLVILVVAVAAYAMGSSNLRRRGWQRGTLMACTVAGILLGLANVAYHWSGCQERRRGRDRLAVAREYVEVQMEYLGAYLAEQFPKRHALVIHSDSDRLAEAKLDALRRGGGRHFRVDAVFRPDVGEHVGSERALQERFTAAVLDRVVREHPDCDAVIFLVPLPFDLKAVQYWSDPATRPVTAVVASRPGQYGDYLADGRIAVLVSPNPAAATSFGEALPADLEAAFRSRYQLQTAP